MADQERFKNVATGVSAVVGLIALLVSLFSLWRQASTEQIRNWQEVVVFSIIMESGVNGLKFEEIRSRYREEALAIKDLDLPREEIQESSLNRVLLNLMSKRIIAYTRSGKYKIAFMPEPDELRGTPEEMALHARIEKAADDAIATVKVENCRYTPDQLGQILQRENPELTLREANGLLTQMIADGMFHIDEQGRLCSITEPRRRESP
jgi:hypothetical protein